MAIRIRVSGVCFSFSFRHSFRYHPAPKESQGIRAPPEEEIRTSSAGTPCADKQRGQTTLRGRPPCAQLLQQLEPLELQRLPSVGAAAPQHLSQRLRTHTHTHTHPHTHTHTLFWVCIAGATRRKAVGCRGREPSERERGRALPDRCRAQRPASGDQLSRESLRGRLSAKCRAKKRLPFTPGSGEARERGERGKAAGPN